MLNILKNIIIFFILIAFLVLSFLLQQEFYTLEMGLFYGTFILILIELTKLTTELTIFSKVNFKSESRKWFSKGAVALLAIGVIGMSFYATKETIGRLNQDSVNSAQKQRQVAIDFNNNLTHRKKIIQDNITGLNNQIKTNDKLLTSYSNDPREFWKLNVKNTQNDNKDLKKRLNQANVDLLALSQIKPKYVPKIDTKTVNMNIYVIFFLAAFMEAGVLFLCWFVTKNFKKVKMEVKQESTPIFNDKVNKIKEILNNQSVIIKEHPINFVKNDVNNDVKTNVNYVSKIDDNNDNNDKNDLIVKLKEKLEKSNMSQEDFAKKKLGISRVSMWKILSRKGEVSEDMFKRIEKVVA